MFPKFSLSKLHTYQKIIIGIVFLFIFLSFLPAPKLIQTEGFSKAVYDSNGKLLRLTLSPDDRYRLRKKGVRKKGVKSYILHLCQMSKKVKEWGQVLHVTCLT